MDSPPSAQKRLSIASVVVLLAGIALLGLLFWGAARLLMFLLRVLSTLDPNVAAAIIAGSTTIIAAILALTIGKYFEAKAQRRAAHRDKKINLYDSFLERLWPLFTGGAPEGQTTEDLVPVKFLREMHRSLILWSGPEVLRAYAIWKKGLTTQGDAPRAKSMIQLVDFLFALRKDLGHSNKSIKPEYLVGFMLREPGLFMTMYKKNPNVTLQEIAAAEERLKAKKE